MRLLPPQSGTIQEDAPVNPSRQGRLPAKHGSQPGTFDLDPLQIQELALWKLIFGWLMLDRDSSRGSPCVGTWSRVHGRHALDVKALAGEGEA